MRVVGFVLAAFAFVQQAQAADLGGVLRGAMYELRSPAYFRWGGFYGGAQWGYSSASIETTNTTSDLIAFILRNTTIESEGRVSEWTTLPDTATTASTFGGFAGYNAQWESAVLGLEINYNRGKIRGTATDSIGRSFTTSTQYMYFVDVTASASVEIKETATFRARAAYAFGRFLPYATVGLAVGRADRSATATVDLTAIDISFSGRPDLALNETRTDTKKDIFTFGWAAGVGIDIMLLQNIFLRGEFERMEFTTNGVRAGISSARAGLGLKF